MSGLGLSVEGSRFGVLMPPPPSRDRDRNLTETERECEGCLSLWVLGCVFEFRVSSRVESPGFGVEGCEFVVFRVQDLVSGCSECSVSGLELRV